MMEDNLKELCTEQRNPRSENIDQMSTLDILKAINEEDKGVAFAIQNKLNEIEAAADAAYHSLRQGGRLIYIGAGTSGRLGILDASECPPTYGVDSSMVQGIMAGGIEAIQQAKEGAEDNKGQAKEDLKKLQLTKKDVVCGLAASGRTPYVIGGLEYASQMQAVTIAISCVENSLIGEKAQYPISILVGPEIVTGSTRMKAGTAQKMILNMLSTTIMIKLGKVYKNFMVDVKPSNEKLEKRAVGIIAASTQCEEERALKYFLESGKNVKLAILMILSGATKEECYQYLDEQDGNVSKAIRRLKEKK